ncbi:UPF0280 family protein [Methanoplanus sp. FWC-SCC4]|uniref:UPF0280 protein F1737_03810 n=1 Tax=Methanochimaera problematica TaxID=2609417 RepID=A0AA97I2R5_9EURY|nr:UPF0280 family protein [Methanoplanus sp. FWC-SCC4]WOF15883.1 UPF0280 family protein [Methanoplanus sp. FWC-SCC4]
MIREYFKYKTTITTILADKKEHIETAKNAMINARQEIERTILKDPIFGSSLEPYETDSDSEIIRKMTNAGNLAGTGPMASVAGTIAWEGVSAMKNKGAKFAVIDNGGDIALISDRTVKIGLYAGNSPLSKKMAFLIPPAKEITGICTSSATVGPSISFGIADSVTVFSNNVSLADAWATSICNQIKMPFNDELFNSLENSDIIGVFAVIGKDMIRWGEIPKIAAANVDENLITSG